MHDNDKTIFNYLNPLHNDILSQMKDKDLAIILTKLDKYYLEYRKTLGLGKNDTFGIEIETEHFKGSVFERWPFQLEINKIVANDKWDSRNDITLIDGMEVVSEILIDKQKTWDDIKNVCQLTGEYASIDLNCAAHVHVGAHILGENSLYWCRLFKLCSVYENIIYRFGYGEYLTHRPKINSHSKPTSIFFQEGLERVCDYDVRLIELLYIFGKSQPRTDYLRDYGISFWHMLCDEDYMIYEDYNKINEHCTLEFRSTTGTLDPIVWQNNINFFVKLMLYCKSDKFDLDTINKRFIQVQNISDDLWAYSKIYVEQAIELCDMIFDNNLDKIYFLRQYLKSFETSDKPFAKAKKYTMSKI